VGVRNVKKNNDLFANDPPNKKVMYTPLTWLYWHHGLATAYVLGTVRIINIELNQTT
jgi:hypothetical protein